MAERMNKHEKNEIKKRRDQKHHWWIFGDFTKGGSNSRWSREHYTSQSTTGIQAADFWLGPKDDSYPSDFAQTAQKDYRKIF